MPKISFLTSFSSVSTSLRAVDYDDDDDDGQFEERPNLH